MRKKRIKKGDVIKEINDKSKIEKNKREVTDEISDIEKELVSQGFTDDDAKTTAVDIVTKESVNKTTVSITKGKLLETILNKKPRKVVKTIRVCDLKK